MANTEQSRQPLVVKNFFDAVADVAAVDKKNRRTLSADAAKSVLSDNGIVIPNVVSGMLARYDEKVHAKILDSVLSGMSNYQREHGFAPDPSFVEFAVGSALRSVSPLGDLAIPGIRLDNATNNHHDQLSLQPAVAMVSIMAQFAEAIPYAAYLPADVKSNEARLAIMSNKAQSDFGDYLDGASLDGIAGGDGYLDSERMCTLSINGGGGSALTFTVTQKASNAVGGIAVAGGNVAMPLLPGRTTLWVNGLPAGRETDSYTSGSNAIAGQAVIGGTTYTISGTVNSATGVISVTSSPVLPAGTVLEALAYIDYEKAPDYAPKIGTDVTVYRMFARSSRGIVKSTIDAMTQMTNELSLDPRGQALMSLRSQYAQERHYRVIRKMLRIAANLTDTWAYGYSTQIAQKSRSDIWQNLFPILGGLSQTMANRTVDHGINTLYLTGELAAQVKGLPSDMWEPSGITDRPGIYRLGRLNRQWDCYYTPKGLTESGGGDVSQILAVGRASNVARNPIVLGEAVPGMILPLAMNGDMVTSDGFYTRNFTEVNPHVPSAQGAALINVTGIKS